ncbi:MAG: zinc ribbon domain-containing protein [Xanthomonadales bacterium]|nr:zinc ribbon domain-containing protein [Xanthomonadales bacterium]
MPIDDAEGLHLLLPVTALKALALPPALDCGPLSPLARIPMPAAPADPQALRAALEQADAGTALATLLDPGLLVTLLLDDPLQPALASWIYPDPGGSGEGWRVEVEGEVLGIGGPVQLTEIAVALQAWLDPAGVAALAPIRLGFKAAEAWTLLALVDAWEGLQHLRRGLRLPGPPLALSRGDLLQAWTMACASGRRGYAVARARWLCPDQAPPDVEVTLSPVLDALEQAGLLVQLPGTAERADDCTLLPTGSLAALCRLLAEARGFGLLRAESTPGQVRLDAQLGWRSPAGIAVMDLSRLAEDHAELLLCGPEVAVPLLGHLLTAHAAPADDGRLRRRRDELHARSGVAALRADPARLHAPAPTSRHCSQCGVSLSPTARYCGNCGAKR